MLKRKWKQRLAALMAVAMLGIPTVPAEAAAPTLYGVDDVSEATAMALAQALVGDDVKVVSADIYGSAVSFGTFENATDLVGFSSGLVVSTGTLKQGGQDIFSSGYQTFFSKQIGSGSYKGYDWPGFDPNNTFYDMTYLDITYIPTTEYVSFQYSVASEEYPEYIHNYFDQFVLLVNGVNYAVVPGTDEMVTIGTVNHEHNPVYYRGMQSPSGVVSETNFVYDGITVVFSVNAKVNVGKENTIRIAIADKDDAVYDSAVFIKGNSIKEQEAAPGTITVGEIEDGKLTLDREDGSDGFVSVDVTFEDSDENVISTENVSFNDGEDQKQIAVPANATYFFLTAVAGGVEVDEKVATPQNVENYVPVTEYGIKGQVRQQQIKTVLGEDATGTVSGGDAMGTVSGGDAGATVTADGVTPVADANVSIKGDVNRDTKTDGNGEFAFKNIAAGVYEITAAKDGMTGVDIIKVNGKETPWSIDLHKGSTIVNEGDTGLMIGGLNALNGIDSLDDDDKKVLAENGSIDIVFNAGKASAEDIEALKKATNQEISVAYNLDIAKVAKNEAGETEYSNPITDTEKNMISIVMPLTDEQKQDNMTGFKVYRVHGDETGVITEKPNADGEYIEVLKSEGVAILHVNKFSLYSEVIGVIDEQPSTETPEPSPEPTQVPPTPDNNQNSGNDNSDSAGSDTSNKVVAPKTGEPEMTVFWMMMGMLAVGVAFFGSKAVRKKK